MPIARDMRNDRRRRVLRENVAAEAPLKTRSRSQIGENTGINNATKRSAGYSQDVRRACSQRLVQLIPVRPTSFAAVVLGSLLIPIIISAAHYLVYVNGWLPWYGHPLATILDANHNRSLASWFTGQLWLMCLAATILTFQLRRHKLDDYSGEYRLWFWLVCTCIIGSIEASTGIIYLFSLALDNWSMNQLGWSGPAVVKATLSVLIGMLGLRLCTELKTTPSSVVFILIGLVAWAVSATLAQPEFLIELAPQKRIWARSSLWIGGLTCIWLAALANLRHVYIEAQQRFLSRSRALQRNASTPWKDRIKSAMPALPRREQAEGETSRFRLPAYFRKSAEENSESGKPKANGKTAARGSSKSSSENPTSQKSRKTRAADNHPTERTAKPVTATSPTAEQASDEEPKTKRKLGLGGIFRSKAKEPAATDDRSDRPERTQSASANKTSANRPSGNTGLHQDTAAETKKRGRLSGWFGKRSGDEGPPAPNDKTNNQAKASRDEVDTRSGKHKNNSANEGEKQGRLAGWLRKPKNSDDADEFKKVPRDKSAGRKQQAASSQATKEDGADTKSPRRWIPNIKAPSVKKPAWLKMPSIRLKPPTDSAEQGTNQKTDNRSLPSTAPSGSKTAATASQPADSQSQSNARPMTKAERKRLRRMQQQNKAA